MKATQLYPLESVDFKNRDSLFFLLELGNPFLELFPYFRMEENSSPAGYVLLDTTNFQGSFDFCIFEN